MSDSWTDFLAARHRLVHDWAAEGKSAKEITELLNSHDVTQIAGLIEYPLQGKARDREELTRLELFLATLMDDLKVPPMAVARAIGGLGYHQASGIENAIRFRSWHHAGYRAFLADLVATLLGRRRPDQEHDPEP
jgi:hypothetical protein